jgi:hypothetical protein
MTILAQAILGFLIALGGIGIFSWLFTSLAKK